MGTIISKVFKKKREKSTYEKLEDIETKIKEIEEFSDLYQLKQKRFVGNLLLYGITTSVIAFLTFYFAFLPKTLEKKIIYSVPILSLPAFIFLLKNLVAWYFQRKVNSNSEQLAELRAEKRQLLDQVKTKETYKDAVEILQRFGGASDKSFTSPSAITTTPIRSNSPSNSMNNTKMMVNTSTNMTPSMAAFKTPAARQLVQVNQNISALQQRMNSQTTPFDGNRALMIAPSSVSAIRSSKRTPYPIIDSTQKSVVDKMVDYLIGDGPSNRFAMICQQCFKHNGMALQEEYEYAAFRCAFCNFFNPAKKCRPAAPRLPIKMAPPSLNIQRPSTSDSSNSVDSDLDLSDRKLSLPQKVVDDEVVSEEFNKNDGVDEIDEEEIDGEEIEFIEKPERKDIEKKLE